MNMGKYKATPSRRAVATAALGAPVAATVASAVGARASAAVSYTPGSYPATPVLPAADRHLVNRFSYGLSPSLVAEVRAAGGASAWFNRQLAVGSSTSDSNLADWWPDLHRSPMDLYQRQLRGTRYLVEVMRDYGNRLMVRRAATPHQVREVMTEFWENHLHVPARGDQQFWRTTYGDAIRPHALGRFDQLLPAAISHPAMLVFLDNALSTKDHPNENLGRELLELHTVGVGTHTEDDVKNSARILTGWTVDIEKPPYGTIYKPEDHWTGPVQVLDFRDANAAPDGRDVALRYLSYLAHHPATARHLARKLALAFVSDTPSEALVESLAKVYLANGTAIVPVLRALVASAEFKASAGAKLRDAAQDVIATHRVLGTVVYGPSSPDNHDAANTFVDTAGAIGMPPVSWPRPDGQPVTNREWSSPARVMASAEAHWLAASSSWPQGKITYPSRTSWVPQASIAFRDLVDHLARRLHGKPSSATLLRACCEAVGVTPTAVVKRSSGAVATAMPQLLAVFLDHPDHLYH